ncbi:pYEATS domain-containing protein [Thalassomonas sp. RHCl1]|uniref:pYEATS domain-containing protein n=1 Tax=Thalassomonas sp. RHCl1 TaxID=2995320 RepID=UPI00248CCE85|nr:pYEATS domain-containing protein [Thalassomonas sp. RHCl1]
MNIEQIFEWISKFIELVLIGFGLFFAWRIFHFSKKSGSGFSLKFSEFVEVTVEPAQTDIGSKTELEDTSPASDKLPADYYYLNHVAFLRQEKQEEFQQRTGLVDFPHYDIRVILDSYYKGAMEKVKYVEYFLHKSYPEPIQTRSNLKNKFLLKELANGEYVLQAKVHITGRREPLILQRYITLEQNESFAQI